MKKASLSNLIKALQIIEKYGDTSYPTHCEHDVMYVTCDTNKVSPEDLALLEEFGFTPNCEFGVPCLVSYRYGSS